MSIRFRVVEANGFANLKIKLEAIFTNITDLATFSIDLEKGAGGLFQALIRQVFTAISSVTFAGSGLNDMTVAAANSYTGAEDARILVTMNTVETAAIASVADAGGGDITVTSNAHGLVAGQRVTISGSTDYDGDYLINAADTNTFDVTVAFNVTRTGTWTNESFAWAKDGVEQASDVDIVGSGVDQALAEGIVIEFAAAVGHTATESWQFDLMIA